MVLYKCIKVCDAILSTTALGASMKRKEQHGTSIFVAKLDENYRSVREFWRGSGLEQSKALSFETLRRVIYEDDRAVNPASLAIIMHALGFARSEIVEELRARGDEYFYQLINQPGGEREISADDRELLDYLSRIGIHNQKLRNALMRLIGIASEASTRNVEDPQNGPLHCLAGANISESMKPAFLHALKILIDDLRERCETPDQFRMEIDARNSMQVTPLMAACMAQNEEAALLLLKEGADVSVADNRGRTVMHYIDVHHLGTVFGAVKETNPSAVMDYYVAMWSESDSVLHT